MKIGRKCTKIIKEGNKNRNQDLEHFDWLSVESAQKSGWKIVKNFQNNETKKYKNRKKKYKNRKRKVQKSEIIIQRILIG